MRNIIVIAAMAVLTVPMAFAECVGAGAYSSCWDDKGNTYDVIRSGNTTHTYGRNKNGDTWSQDSYTTGGTTQHYGRDKDGNHWNSTTTDLGGGYQSHSGRDSDGNYYNCTSGPYGSDC